MSSLPFMSWDTHGERCDAERPDAKPKVTDFRWVMWMSNFVQSKLLRILASERYPHDRLQID